MNSNWSVATHALLDADPRRRGSGRAGAIDDARIEQIDADFGRIHEQLFGRGSGFRAGGVDLAGFQVRATARTTKPQLRGESGNGNGSRPAATRSIYWPELREHVPTPVFSSAPAQTVKGPALIELSDTVIAIRPGHVGAPDGAGNYAIELGRAPA